MSLAEERYHLQSIIEEIDKFAQQCREREYTDTDAAWELLNWIRDTAAYMVEEED